MMPEVEFEYLPTSEPKNIGRPACSILMQASFMTSIVTFTYVIPRPPTMLPSLLTVRSVLYSFLGSLTRENISWTVELVIRIDFGEESSLEKATGVVFSS